MWYLCENVYMVEGYKNAAIYDFNNKLLFQINSEAKCVLAKAMKEEWTYTEEENKFLCGLRDKGIITSHFVESHEIHQLAENKRIDFVWIELTTACNLKCVHCYDEASCDGGTVMDYNQYCHIIDEILELGIKKVQFIGGEPFILGEKIFDYLDYAVGKFEYIEIFTNGTLIKEKWLDYIKIHDIRLALSVYSYIEDEHNKITGNKESWKKTNDTIKRISNKGIMYRVKNVLMSDLDLGKKNTELYSLSRRKDVVRLVGRADQSLLTRELLKKKLITKDSFSAPLDKKLVARFVSGHNCFARRLYFSADLKVYPCVMERRRCYGSIKNIKLDTIINVDLQKMNKDYIEGCKDCEFRYACFDCRPDSNGKKFEEKSWYCTYDPFKGEWEPVELFLDHFFCDL